MPSGPEESICGDEKFPVKRFESGPMAWVDEVIRRERERPKSIGGEVTTTLGEVAGQIAKDVDQLQTLAELNSEPGESFDLARFKIEQVIRATRRPEFSDATGDPVGVVHEFIDGLEGVDGRMGLRFKTPEVKLLTADNDSEDTSEVGEVGGSETGGKLERLFDAEEEGLFSLRGGGGRLGLGDLVELNGEM